MPDRPVSRVVLYFLLVVIQASIRPTYPRMMQQHGLQRTWENQAVGVVEEVVVERHHLGVEVAAGQKGMTVEEADRV
jgi:hypothetical protein